MRTYTACAIGSKHRLFGSSRINRINRANSPQLEYGRSALKEVQNGGIGRRKLKCYVPELTGAALTGVRNQVLVQVQLRECKKIAGIKPGTYRPYEERR